MSLPYVSSATVAEAFRNFDRITLDLKQAIQLDKGLSWSYDRRVFRTGIEAQRLTRDLQSSTYQDHTIIVRVDAQTNSMIECLQLIISGAPIDKFSDSELFENMITIVHNIPTV